MKNKLIGWVIFWVCVLTIAYLASSCLSRANAGQKRTVVIELTEQWGQLKVNDELMDHDFTYGGYEVETMAYATTQSIAICRVIIFPEYFIFDWTLKPGVHEEFKTAIIFNKQHNEATEFDIQNSGVVKIPIHKGVNEYDLYTYTGETVGIVEFDIFNALRIDATE